MEEACTIVKSQGLFPTKLREVKADAEVSGFRSWISQSQSKIILWKDKLDHKFEDWLDARRERADKLREQRRHEAELLLHRRFQEYRNDEEGYRQTRMPGPVSECLADRHIKAFRRSNQKLATFAHCESALDSFVHEHHSSIGFRLTIFNSTWANRVKKVLWDHGPAFIFLFIDPEPNRGKMSSRF
jgi:hypothetical protein